MSIKDAAWIEKYRPRTVSKVMGEHRDVVKAYLENPDSIPNFLFHSRVGGTGKTSMAGAIVRDLGCDVLTLNASADRSINNIREEVREYARSKSTNGLKRCVFMDEAEKLTKDAMDALKNMIEEYAANAFYIFTTNNIAKINQPIQSMFVVLEFSKPDREEIKQYLIEICNDNSMSYEESAIDYMIDKNYPSIRACVSDLQRIFVQKQSVTKDVVAALENAFEMLWGMIKEYKIIDVKKYIYLNAIDVRAFNKWIFHRVTNPDEFDTKTMVKLIRIVAKTEREMRGCDENIVFVSGLVEIMAVV